MNLKFSLTLISIITCALTSNAQISKDSRLFGTSIGYSQSKIKSTNVMLTNTKSTSFVVSPSAGIAIKENLVAGIRLDYSKSTEKYNYDYTSYNNTENKYYGGGVFLRQYVPVVNRFYVFGEGGLSYLISRSKYTQQSTYSGKNEIKTKGWSTGLSFTPGISYAISKNFQIESGFNSLLNVSYAKSKSSYESSQPAKMSAFSGGIGNDNGSMFYVGFRFLM